MIMSPRPDRDNNNKDRMDPPVPPSRAFSSSESSEMTHQVTDVEEGLGSSSSGSVSAHSASIVQHQEQQQQQQKKGSGRSLKATSGHSVKASSGHSLKPSSNQSIGGKNPEMPVRRSSMTYDGDNYPSGEDYDSDEARDNFGTDDETPDDSSFYGDDVEDEDDDSSFFSSSSMIGGGDSVKTSTSESGVTGSTGDLEMAEVGKKEATTVRRVRIAAVILILVLAVVLISVILVVGKDEQSDTFGYQFEQFSQELGAAWQMRVAALFVAVDALAVDVSLGTGTSDWPFVTVPEFQVVATSLRYNEPAVVSTALAPMVTEENKLAYENYTARNNDWIVETLEWQLTQQVSDSEANGTRRLHPRQLLDAPVTFTDGIANQIYEIDKETDTAIADKGPSPYFPIRTIDPLKNTRLINYNLASSTTLHSNVEMSFTLTKAVMGPVVPLDEEPLMMDPYEASLVGSLAYPVLRSVDSISRETVGVLSVMFNWPTLMQDTLPAQAEGIICVMRNTCDQVVTMQVNGADAFLLGYGDLHDASYDSYAITYMLDDGLDALETSTISRVEFDGSSPCQFSMSVYPSDTTKAGYGSQPATGAAIAAGVAFFLALLVFVAYDYIQERRNRSILRSAHEARAIVSSLFPANVRERLFETSREKRRQKDKKKRKKHRKLRRKKSSDDTDGAQSDKVKDGDRLGNINNISNLEASPSYTSDAHPATVLSPTAVKKLISGLDHTPLDYFNDAPSEGRKTVIVSHPKHRLKTFLNSSTQVLDMSAHGSFHGTDKPIADLFPHTTVLFADIAGFTAWSSEREPEQVFKLLQTVYQSFDKIARRRGVFKVETIGDCYVAVTGLPDPQPDHAVRMAKFAKECITKMGEVTKGLEVSLGPDTGDLCLRLGMNSGPVTAGVLQGEKSRFQLFGDTVNTASRMESTGEINRIHVSESTAKLLKEAGKAYWVKEREDLVHAKGKGQIQTYWVLSSRTNLEPTRSAENILPGGERTRAAPSRTRSMLTCRDPIRGVQRTTSGTEAKIGKASEMTMTSQSNEAAEQREQRLVEWHLDMFVRLLKRIVAARNEKELCEEEVKYNGNPTKNEWKETHIALAPGENDNKAFVEIEVDVKDIILNGPSKPNSFKIPKQRPSFAVSNHSVFGVSNHSAFGVSTHSAMSWDMNGVSILGSSFGDFSFSSQTQDGIPDKIVVDEVAEVIALPQFTPRAISAIAKSDDIELSETVVSQLRNYITTIAQNYRKNHFHNFEHASHVTMSANKLLNRVSTPENVDYDRETNAIASDLHDYTYGITSDPLTQFAVLFSALIHDVDHTGVSNGQLAKENKEMAQHYRGQSIAEQNSVDLAWELFLDPMYYELQTCIAVNEEECNRFRQLVVNSVMATDIFDPTMKELRNKRWDKAFHRSTSMSEGESRGISLEDDRNMKATIVIEHIIQASDVAHTMQHWHIYTKWNEKLFGEMYSAYECGRAEKNPAESWYQGELWFFDNYVIPLARKLEECNVFGVASDECLNYATANRNEWQIKGEEIVLDMVSRYNKNKFFVAGVGKKRAPTRREKGKARAPKEV